MSNLDGSEHLRYLLRERAARPLREELLRVVDAVRSIAGEEIELIVQLEASDVYDPWARFKAAHSAGSVERVASTGMSGAIDLLAARLSGQGSPPWLVVPQRPEQIGWFRFVEDPSVLALESLARWDGEGLLVTPESRECDGWAFVDIDGYGLSQQVHVSVGLQLK